MIFQKITTHIINTVQHVNKESSRFLVNRPNVSRPSFVCGDCNFKYVHILPKHAKVLTLKLRETHQYRECKQNMKMEKRARRYCCELLARNGKHRDGHGQCKAWEYHHCARYGNREFVCEMYGFC